MEREPDDRMKELTYLTICLSDSNLSATARIYGYMSEGLVGLFEAVAREWRSFRGPISWSSLECELNVEITHDGLGRFSIVNNLTESSIDPAWEVTNTVIVETSQLDRIAYELRTFIGQTTSL
jgi:hypothetical protein